jgi:hypothetical protein
MPMKKVSLLALAILAAFAVVVVPAQAKKQHPAQSHKCTPHNEAYTVRGTLVSGSLTKNANGTYSGTLVVHVNKANSHAKSDKGTTKTYALSDAKAKLHGEDGAALTANSRVTLEGKVTTLAKKCDQTGFTPTVTIAKADIRPPKA